MARNFSINGLNASGSADKTLLSVHGSTLARPRVFDIVLGSAASPADQAALYYVGRVTTLGTAGSNPTPGSTDPVDIASLSVAAITHSAEPTYTTILLQIPLNQRATFRYVASPGAEFMHALTSNYGIGLKLSTSTTAMVEYGTILYFE